MLLSVSFVARALSIALRLHVHTKSGNMISNRAARPHGQSVQCERAERIFIFDWITGHSFMLLYINKWPTRGLWNKLSSV